jgi:hypothetical protein
MASRFAFSALSLLAVFTACSAGATGARADEAFLCGPDTVVYVKPAELELKKRTDPCIARYFGLTVTSPEAEAADKTSSAASLRRDPGPAKNVPAARKNIAFKSLQAPETDEPVTPPPPARTAALQPPAAAPGTDYRNVRVINASSPSDQWFKHTR